MFDCLMHSFNEFITQNAEIDDKITVLPVYGPHVFNFNLENVPQFFETKIISVPTKNLLDTSYDGIVNILHCKHTQDVRVQLYFLVPSDSTKDTTNKLKNKILNVASYAMTFTENSNWYFLFSTIVDVPSKTKEIILEFDFRFCSETESELLWLQNVPKWTLNENICIYLTVVINLQRLNSHVK